jgi:hypothetical protein
MVQVYPSFNIPLIVFVISTRAHRGFSILAKLSQFSLCHSQQPMRHLFFIIAGSFFYYAG